MLSADLLHSCTISMMLEVHINVESLFPSTPVMTRGQSTEQFLWTWAKLAHTLYFYKMKISEIRFSDIDFSEIIVTFDCLPVNT